MKDCNQCGKCCTHYGGGGGLSASPEDIARWRATRPDIAKYVIKDEIWFSPRTGEQLADCPWLRQAPGKKRTTCDIYDDRPQECRHFPVTVDQMVAIDCEMIEPHDLQRPRQAQREVDRLMQGSRPPYR